MTDTNNLIEHTFAWETIEGISLRDYFAGQALAGILSNSETERFHQKLKLKDGEWMKGITVLSFSIADAMLKEREK